MSDFCFLPKTIKPHGHVNLNENLLIITQHENLQNDDVYSNQLVSFSTIRMMLTSWLNRRRTRYLFLILCLPLLLPLLCATCPFLCAAEIFSYVCRRRRKAEVCGVEKAEDEVELLLDRYLEDQLLLVIGSAHECGYGDEDLGVDTEYLDNMRPLLQ